MNQATARANSNIAFIKYWGNADERLHLPLNSTLSMNLDGILTETTVRWDDSLSSDQLQINSKIAIPEALQRVSNHLDIIRERASISTYAYVESFNNFPMGAGIASSASSFAALTLAATSAIGLRLSERELSIVARLGSGSASRSVPTGFVEWHKGNSHEDSYSESVAAPEFWELVDVIAVISEEHKSVGSKRGHTSAFTSDLQNARISHAEERFSICKRALLDKDFTAFAEVVEQDSNLMHAIMMTSRPPLFYWLPATLSVMNLVRQWREDGLQVCYTLDAGPNVHCLCMQKDSETIKTKLSDIEGVKTVLVAKPGNGATILAH